MDVIKYFIGPMSKNIVDSIIEFTENTNIKIALIPSRRQVEFNGGYVNKWNTATFTEYVKSKTNKILLQRDHSGPEQGSISDDGYESLKYDCENFDLIHIDPWKKYPSYSDGLKWTVDMIKFCDSINPKLHYEVGTEQSIRKFDATELDKFLNELKANLQDNNLFYKIKYLVIQSGTSLKGNLQTGNYDKQRLIDMINVAKNYNLLTKEHNGDYIPVSLIKDKFDMGLDSINIAPEFGLIETETYLNEMNLIDDKTLFVKYWEICYNSNKWKKWVDENFNPFLEKEAIIKICGHYVLSDESFVKDIKSNFPNIDEKIKTNIQKKLISLHEYNTEK